MERELHDLCADVEHLARLARQRDPAFGEQIKFAGLVEDDNSPNVATLRASRRAFDDLPEDEQRRILAGWRPVRDRPRGRRVAADMLHASGMIRAMLISPDNDMRPVVWHDYVFTDSTSPVEIIVKEGALADDVLNVLESVMAKIETSWREMIDRVPKPIFEPIAGQVWKASDFQGCFTGYLVTDAGNLDRPIAYVDASGAWELSEEEALAVAEKIAADPRTAGYQRCIDLRAYGYDDSRLPTPAFVYALWCEPVGDDAGVQPMHPSPFCKFRALTLKEQEAAIFWDRVYPSSAQRKRGQSEGQTVLSPASKANGEARSPMTA